MEAFLSSLLLALTAIQGLTMVFDEFIFHKGRGLETFERWGHVADTGLFFLALLVPALFWPNFWTLLLFGILAVASSLLITKDEWIHASSCTGAEQWCHSLLFILHGPILLSFGLLWYLDPSSLLLKGLPALVFLWGVYQFYYWNIYYARSHQTTSREQSVL